MAKNNRNRTAKRNRNASLLTNIQRVLNSLELAQTTNVEVFELLRSMQSIHASDETAQETEFADTIIRDYLRRVSCIMDPVKFFQNVSWHLSEQAFRQYTDSLLSQKQDFFPKWNRWSASCRDITLARFESKVASEYEFVSSNVRVESKVQNKIPSSNARKVQSKIPSSNARVEVKVQNKMIHKKRK